MSRQIDVQRLVRSLGGPAHLHRRLVQDGHGLSPKAVQMWITRRSIPSRWLAVFSEMKTQEGKEFRLGDYLKSDVQNADYLE